MATYPVTHINSEMRGAPIITGNTRGNLIAAIDAWRLGFGQVTAVSVTVTGGVATAVLQPDQGFDLHTVIEVAGATPAALNGKSRVTEVNAAKTEIKFPTDAPNGVATGTITIKVAGSGWNKPFSGASDAAYQSADPLSSKFLYRVTETGTVNMARLRGYETMTSLTAGTGLFPTNAQANGGGYWPKSYQADAVPVRYDIIGDSRFVMVGIAIGSSAYVDYKNVALRGFGDPIPLNPAGDAFAACLSCNQSTNATDAQYGTFGGPTSLGSGAIFAARARAGTGTSRDMSSRPYVGTAGGTSGADGALGPFPDPVDGKIKLSQVFLYDDANATYPTARAVVPGLLYVPMSGVAAVIQPRDYLIGTGALEGRILMALPLSVSPTASQDGVGFVDLTGPWRQS